MSIWNGCIVPIRSPPVNSSYRIGQCSSRSFFQLTSEAYTGPSKKLSDLYGVTQGNQALPSLLLLSSPCWGTPLFSSSALILWGDTLGAPQPFILPAPLPSPPTPTEEVPLHVTHTLSLMVHHLLSVLHHQPPSWATSAASPSLPGLCLSSKTSTDCMHLKNTTNSSWRLFPF